MFGGVLRKVLALSLLPLACAEAPSTPLPAHAAPVATPTTPPISAVVTTPAPVAKESKTPETTQDAFYRAFLSADDVGARFQSLAGPDVARGVAHHYGNGSTPDGLQWVADATWSDPHGYEPLRRIEETRWYFSDEAKASRFIESRVGDLREHWRSEDTQGPCFGSDCHVLTGTVEETTGSSTHYVYVFRVARLVAQLWFSQGPRSHTPLTEDLVVPLARRAAQRAAESQGMTSSTLSTSPK